MQSSRSITRKSASNLALAFILLPRPRRDAMSALYAFCREVDDVADEDTVAVDERRRRLNEWREDIRRVYCGKPAQMMVNSELGPVIRQYRLPLEHFEAVLRGVEMDLDRLRYPNYPELENYCYHVASVVGLLSIEIFGYRCPSCRDYAVHLGQALQLTNILRDVKTDAARGRIYLPLDELARFKVTEAEIFKGVYSDRFTALAESVAGQARQHYSMARRYLAPEDRSSMGSAELMGSVYWQLLRKLEAQRFNVLEGPPVRLTRAHKLALIARAWLRLARRSSLPSYGEE